MHERIYAHDQTHACVQVLQALQYQYADAAVQAAGGPAVHPHSRAGSNLDNMSSSALAHPLPYGQLVQPQEARNDGRKGQAMSLATHPSAGMAMGAAVAAFASTNGLLSTGGGGARSVGMLGGGFIDPTQHAAAGPQEVGAPGLQGLQGAGVGGLHSAGVCSIDIKVHASTCARTHLKIYPTHTHTHNRARSLSHSPSFPRPPLSLSLSLSGPPGRTLSPTHIMFGSIMRIACRGVA